jgi:hypothetical protein
LEKKPGLMKILALENKTIKIENVSNKGKIILR